MSAVTDWIQTGALIFLGWQQNRIFERQNQIFEKQAGQPTMPDRATPRFSHLAQRYWPMAVMAGLAALTGYDIYDRHVNRNSASKPESFWLYAPLFVILASGIVWVAIFIRNRIRRNELSPPERKPPTSEESIVKSSDLPITLKQLFEIEWPNLPAFYHECVLNSQIFESGSVKVAWRVNGDFVGRSKFLAILIDPATKVSDAFKACEAIVDQFGHLIDSPNSEVDIQGQAPDDTAPTHLKDMVFSKRIFIYYEDFSLAQKGMLETIYQSKELSVQFRDAAYAWAHRDDKPRAAPLVPNTTILPDAKLIPGLRIKITKLSPGVNREKGFRLLSYAQMDGAGWFMGLAPGSVFLQLVQIKNSESALPVNANNVRAKITYTHADARNFFIVPEALWWSRTDMGANTFVSSVNLKPNTVGNLVLVAEQGQQERRKCVVQSNGTLTELLSGHWDVRIELSCDNSQPMEGRGGFTVMAGDNRIVYDEPALAFRYA